MSFDLCDRQPSVEVALQMLLQHFDQDSIAPLSSPREALDKLAQLSRTGRYDSDLAQLLAAEKNGHAEFRRLLSANRITHLDRFIGESPDACGSSGATTAVAVEVVPPAAHSD
jgi:hypothetical protein